VGHEDDRLLGFVTDLRRRALEIEAGGDLLHGLLDGVLDLHPVDLGDDVERGVGHGPRVGKGLPAKGKRALASPLPRCFAAARSARAITCATWYPSWRRPWSYPEPRWEPESVPACWSRSTCWIPCFPSWRNRKPSS